MLSARRKLQAEAIEKALNKLEEDVKRPLSGLGGTGGDQGRYGAVVLNEAGNLELKGVQHPCHAFMRNYKKAVVVFNQYSHREKHINKKADKAFFDWITSDDGPWREFPNRLVSEMPKDIEDKKDWIFKNGWVWTNLEVPANLQHSFLTAARMPGEWPLDINRWYKMVTTYDLPRDLTFLYLTLFMNQEKIDKKYFKLFRVNKYDWPVDINTADEEYVKNFCSGKVSNLIQMYSKDPEYRPVNKIFGRTEDVPEKDRYVNVIHSLYAGKIGMSDVECSKLWEGKTGYMSGYSWKTHWLLTEEEIATVIKEEKKRLK